jgi:predicted Zn finger-like uncharacterized protein
MLITCQNCATSYEVEPSSLGTTGRSVRCARCGQVWFAANTVALSAIAEDHRAAMAAFAAPSEGDERADLSAEPPADETPPLPPEPAGTEYGWNVSDAPGDTPAAAGDVAPGEPVTITDAPALAPTDAAEPALPDPAPPGEDIETVAARRTRQRARQRGDWLMPGLGTALLALIAINMGLIGWRADVVRLLPQTASLYAAVGLPVNLRGLNFTKVKTVAETQDGVQLLVVEGTIVNATSRVVEVPRLRFSVRNDRGYEIYTWTALPPKSLLAPGEPLAFRSRLASPPREAHQVLVRFFNRRDLVAGRPSWHAS